MTEQRHIHADAIIAFAEGREIQYQCRATDDQDEWHDCDCCDVTPWFNNQHYRWRVKPKTVIRKGWIAISKKPFGNETYASSNTHPTKDSLIKCMTLYNVNDYTITEIEWPEEE